MGKAPAFMFYVGDYLQDTRCLSLAARGAWVDCLCAMWRSPIRGEVTLPLIGYARLFGCSVEQARAVIDELVEMQTCDRVTHGDEKVTVINRRMSREAKGRKLANNRQLRYVGKLKSNGGNEDDAKNDAEMTPHYSYSSSYSVSKLENNICVKHSDLGEIPDDESDQTQNSLLEYFQQKHVAKLKRQTNLFDSAKILPKAQALMRTHGRETAFKLIDLFFEEDRSVGGRWLQNADYSFNVFASQAERLAQGGHGAEISAEEMAKRVEAIISQEKEEAHGRAKLH